LKQDIEKVKQENSQYEDELDKLNKYFESETKEWKHLSDMIEAMEKEITTRTKSIV